jgi:predicted phage terminase large subunit-like protein
MATKKAPARKASSTGQTPAPPIHPEIIRQAQLELARRDFWYYCHLTAPDFYKEDREFLKYLCNEMQAFKESDDDDVLIIEAPPRHGKSRTAGKFVEWSLGDDVNTKLMTGSYNETLSTMFSKNVRNTIQEEKADHDAVVYSDLFPKTKIKRGDGAMNLWSLEGGYNNYLATSPTGTATGFGCSILMIDDLIKSAEEAFNEDKLESHWNWFTNTMLSRLEENGKIIIIMTRWHSLDLAGRARKHFTESGQKVRTVTLKAQQPDGSMLCDEILSAKSYRNKKRAMGVEIASANYQQTPIDIKGRLYTLFKTYKDIPRDDKGNVLFTEIRNYTDTADEGKDYLCSITYGVYKKEAYILDVLYTKEPMEKTEPATAKMLHEQDVGLADIESNNGGRGFARAVERIMAVKHRSNRTRIHWFHQSKNKKARILSNATWVMDHVYYPVNWADRWPEFCEALNKYQKEGKNKHDDAPDAITGIAERIGAGSMFSFD